MRQAALLIAVVWPLAACSQEPEVDVKNASVGEVAQQVGQAGTTESFVRPGKWESSVQFVSMDAPGMPESARSMIQQMNDRRQVYTTCLKPDDVKKPKEDFFAGNQDGNCRYDHFKMGGGKIDAVMRCSQDGATQVMKMTGDYSPEAYAMQMAMKSEGGPGGVQDMTMNMRVDARRVGECDGKDAD